MKERIGKRFIALVLAFSVSMPLFSVSVSAVDPGTVSAAVAVASFLNEALGVQQSISQSIANAVDFKFFAPDARDPAIVEREINSFNDGGWFGRFLAEYPDVLETAQGLGYLFKENGYVPDMMKLSLRPDPAQNNIMRPWIGDMGWFVDVNGKYPYCSEAAWLEYTGQAGQPGTTAAQYGAKSGHFVDTSTMDGKNPQIVGKTTLEAIQKDLIDNGENCSLVKSYLNGVQYYVILKSGGTRGALFCNRNNQPFVASYEPAAIDQNFNFNQQVVIDTVDQSTTENNIDLSRPIDLSNGTFYFIDENGDRITQNIDSVNFNFDDRSYTVNTYDYEYNITNNYYEFNYYTYNIQYTYNNTYVTYIGSTVEYQPVEYELYYELPDGRSSADLTEADAAALSFQFHDVVNYKRSATDISLRALYHFDGDTDDASFFSKEDSFTWNKGASLTYMESSAFNGALYLDEKEHEFTISLPSSLGSKDFTLQWRYYQNSAATSNHSNDNYVKIGSSTVLGWSEQNLYLMGGSAANSTALSVGTWQELAIVRNNGTAYFYHNGVNIGSASLDTAFNNKIVFHLGVASRAYSMIDELRVTNFAIAASGASYTPTVVPYDTNSVLVLPNDAVPVADEYWSLIKTDNLLPNSDFTYDTTHPNYAAQGKCSFSAGSSSAVISNSGSYRRLSSINNSTLLAGGTVGYSDGTSDILSAFRLTLCRWTSKSAVSSVLYSLDARSDYVFSILGIDGTLYSLPFTTPARSLSAMAYPGTVKEVEFEWGYIGYAAALAGSANTGGYFEQTHTIFVVPKIGVDFEFVYCELKEGSIPNSGHEFVTAVYDKTELQPNTAAIQSDIPVNNYTVGGVRPTFPVRGDVWFQVESSRIAGVQIYNGRAWEQVNARWWTGTRWIPIYAFDIVTLQDMWDVNGSDGDKLQPTITSEYGFWNWWQKEWTDFRGWLSRIWGDGSSGPGGSDSGSSGDSFWDKLKGTIGNSLLVLIEGLFALVTTILEAIIRLVIDLLTFVFGFFTETVIGGITSLFSAFTDGTLFDAFKVEGSDGEISAALPEGIPAVFAFFSGVILALPVELRSLLIFGVAALVLLSVFKFLKS